MTSRVTLHAAHGATTTVSGADGASVAIDGGPEVGGQLLGVAVAGCYANTLLTEASARGIRVRSLDVTVEIEWEHPLGTQSVTVEVQLASDAEESAVMELVEHADRVSMVSNSIRLGGPVRVVNLRVIAPPGKGARGSS
jgi:organic hydroperoxide reductase OsmC/OhrA